MKTLVLVTDLEGTVGGIATFNRLLVSALGRLSRQPNDRLTVLALHDRAGATSLPARYKGFSGRRFRFCWSAWRESWRSDRIFFGHAYLTPLAWAMPRREKILIAHGLEVWRPLSWLRRASLRLMDRVLAVSHFTLEQIVYGQGVDLRRCRVFPNTLADEPALPFLSRSELNLPEGRMLLTVSRLRADEPYKQIDLVLEALVDIVKEEPDVFYVVVGDGDDRHRLESITRELGLTDHVIFAGLVPGERLPSYYESCDLFVLPSLEEGFGIVFLEAMAHAKACVGAQAGGIPDVVIPGVTGLLTMPRDAESLRSAISRLLRHPDERRTMGQAGRERLNAEFSFDRFTNRLQKQLDEKVTSSSWREAA